MYYGNYVNQWTHFSHKNTCSDQGIGYAGGKQQIREKNDYGIQMGNVSMLAECKQGNGLFLE